MATDGFGISGDVMLSTILPQPTAGVVCTLFHTIKEYAALPVDAASGGAPCKAFFYWECACRARLPIYRRMKVFIYYILLSHVSVSKVRYCMHELNYRLNMRFSMKPPNRSSPGEPMHRLRRLPFLTLNQLPVSPGISPSWSSSRFLRVRRSITHIPLVHCPELSTRRSSSSIKFH